MVMSARKPRRSAGFDPQSCVNFLKTRYPLKTAQCVEADLDIPARTVERWLTGLATPNGAAVFALIRAYGPAFVAACLPGLGWVEEAKLRLERGVLEREIAQLRLRADAVAARLEARA